MLTFHKMSVGLNSKVTCYAQFGNFSFYVEINFFGSQLNKIWLQIIHETSVLPNKFLGSLVRS